MPGPNQHPYELLRKKHRISHRDVCEVGNIGEMVQNNLRIRIVYGSAITREHAEKIVAGFQKLTGITYSLEEMGLTILPEGQTYASYDEMMSRARISGCDCKENNI
jgi:hypothetical protein